MATTVLIVVIIVLTSNLAILYLPFDKKRKAQLSLVIIGALVIFCLSHNAWNNETPVQIREKIVMIQDAQVKKSMMATFNVTEETLNIQQTAHTPIENGVAVVLVLALVFTPILLHVVVDNDDKQVKKVHLLAFTLNVVASAFLLSLYFGLKLTIIPWIKKNREKKISIS